MRTLSLGLSLFWRTLLACFLLALAYVLWQAAFGTLGIKIISDGVANSPIYIKAKPSIAFFALGASLMVSRAAFGQNLIQMFWGARLPFSEIEWKNVLHSISALFTVLAFLNWLIAISLPSAFWIRYKLVGSPLIFVVGHLLTAYKFKTTEIMSLPVAISALNQELQPRANLRDLTSINWFLRMYSGQSPLWKVFWFGWVTPLIPLTVAANIFKETVGHISSWIPFAFFLGIFLYQAWLAVSLWRCAPNVTLRVCFWLARIFSVILWLGLFAAGLEFTKSGS
jgi:intracellular septation protein A